MLKGNLAPVIQHYTAEMKTLSANLSFEKAALIKKKIEHLENYQARSVIVSRHISNADVFSILKENDTAYVNYLMVKNGTIVPTHTIQLQIKLEENKEEILPFAINYLRETFNSNAT
jgi:excinuclease ABC subunit C